MASRIVRVADAVTAELNGHVFQVPFTAVRLYQPVYELQEMKALHVTVVPRGILITPLDRAKCEHDVQIDIAVQKKFAAGTNDEIDPLMDLVQEIADFFKQRRLASLPEAIWIETKNVPVYAPEHMQQLRQFTSVLTLSFRLAG